MVMSDTWSRAVSSLTRTAPALTNLRQDQVLALAGQDARGAGRRRRPVSPLVVHVRRVPYAAVQVNRIERKPTTAWAG